MGPFTPERDDSIHTAMDRAAQAGTPPPRVAGVDCPFLSRVHPDLAGIEERHDRWVRDRGVAATPEDVDRILGWRAGWYAAACHPDIDADVVDENANLTAWILEVDNHGDTADSPEQLVRSVDMVTLAGVILDDPHDPIVEPLLADPLLAAWTTTARRLFRVLPAPVYSLTVCALTELWRDMGAGAVRQYTHAVISPATYAATRHYGGMVSNAALAWPATMPMSWWWEPDVRAVRHCAAVILSATNDAVSGPRETHEGRPVDLAALPGMVAGLYERFDILAARVEARGADAVTWVARVRTYLAGHHAWCARTSRYQHSA